MITIGDFKTEEGTLRPLAKSVLQHLRLLLPDDSVLAITLRSIEELKRVWADIAPAFTHIVLIGHGDGDGILFGASDSMLAGPDFAALVDDKPREYLALACKSGMSGFAKPFSKGGGCRSLVAPFNSVHAAVAVQIAALYFGERFLAGRTAKTTFNRLRKVDALVTSRLRFWKDGDFEGT